MKGSAIKCSCVLTMLVVSAVSLVAQSLPDHAAFESVLQRHVHGKLFDYGALAANPADLDQYLSQLGGTGETALSASGRHDQLAFWINAYNACALKLVAEHYPIKKAGLAASLVNSLKGVPANSIRQIPSTWSNKFCGVAGSDRSLDEIEHEIIRPMGDPRIHFAVNCASVSCPVLSFHAYTGEGLDDQLDAAVERFVTDSLQYRLDRSEPVLRVNKILDWYKDDFGGSAGVIEFLMRYVDDGDAEFLRMHREIGVDYNKYDWTLNDTAVFGSGG